MQYRFLQKVLKLKIARKKKCEIFFEKRKNLGKVVHYLGFTSIKRIIPTFLRWGEGIHRSVVRRTHAVLKQTFFHIFNFILFYFAQVEAEKLVMLLQMLRELVPIRFALFADKFVVDFRKLLLVRFLDRIDKCVKAELLRMIPHHKRESRNSLNLKNHQFVKKSRILSWVGADWNF